MKSTIENVFKGFTFGMSLQLAIGPVCLYILNVAATRGFQNAEFGVFGVTIIDALYIGLALFGISAFIRNDKTKRIIEYLGISVLFIFGTIMLFDCCLTFDVQENHSKLLGQTLNTFWVALLLTASNPLTILIWTGIFATRISHEKNNNASANQFAFGCVIATLVFLSLVSFVGTAIRVVLPNAIISVLNGFVGVVFIGFSLNKLIKMQTATKLKRT
jgi:threonine/homoserine/homoserine lactone efflux protein